MSIFHDIPRLPDDPILSLPILFAADERSNKINLGIGAYRTADGLPLVINAVKKAEHILLQKQLNKEYLPIEGDSDFIRLSLQLLFGDSSSFLQSSGYFAAQSVGGASALRVGGEFLVSCMTKTLFIPQPTWANHRQIFERAGFNVGSYPYFDSKTYLLDFNGIKQSIQNMPKGAVVLFHACCHNPTGIDPSFEQWQELSELIKKQQLIIFFDCAYQGFGDGLNDDAKAVRYFAEQGHDMVVAYSYSKNLGLYGERVGFLTVCCSKMDEVINISSQIKSIIRANYSNPPLHGERIVSTILKSLELKSEWKSELENMRERVFEMRKALIASLLVGRSEENFCHLRHQKGLFSFLGLDLKQVQTLQEKYAIYMPSNGRINLAGLNTQNLSYVSESILAVTSNQ